MTGIAYDPKLGGGITSIDQLLDDPKLKGKVTLLTEMADSVGLVMLANGDDPTKVTDASMKGDRPLAEGRRLRPDPPVHRQRLRAAARQGRHLGVLRLVGRHGAAPGRQPEPEVGDPEDGGMIWTDNMLIPKGGDVFTASTFMNFVYDPKIAAQIEAYVNYICRSSAPKEELLKTDPAVANNPLIFPTRRCSKVPISSTPKALHNTGLHQAKCQTVIGA